MTLAALASPSFVDEIAVPMIGFRPGQRVLITDGTFVGTEGRVIGPDETRALKLPEAKQSAQLQHYWVVVEMPGYFTAVELDAEQMKLL
jgi:transcription antitermination factor NusG